MKNLEREMLETEGEDEETGQEDEQNRYVKMASHFMKSEARVNRAIIRDSRNIWRKMWMLNFQMLQGLVKSGLSLRRL